MQATSSSDTSARIKGSDTSKRPNVLCLQSAWLRQIVNVALEANSKIIALPYGGVLVETWDIGGGRQGFKPAS
eukprot:scaffold659384_cov65-Prasinocladus_malaysianus.AAC.1